MNSQTKTALFFFIVIGAVLRVWQVGFQCLWLEEAFTVNISSLPWVEIASSTFRTDFNPPVYYFLAHISEMIFPYDLFAARYPAVISGILLIPAMYLLGREYKDELSGVFCSGVTSILFPLVYYSQYARVYSLSLLFFAVALIFYIRVSRDATRFNEISFWILVGMNAWVHLFTIVPLGLMALDLIAQKPWPRMGYALLSAAICAPLAWMLLAVVKTRAIALGVDYGYGPLMMILITPGELFGVLFILFFALIGMALLVRRDNFDLKLMMIGIVTIITGISLSVFTPVFPRYYLTVALVGILLASSGMMYLVEMICEIIPRGRNDEVPIHLIALDIVVAIVILFLILQAGDFLNYYTVQKYLC